ncbi:TPA: hypothetical protein RZK39_001014 [Campylobacter coli]|nr:hypothetical protein [Campylobacter coli]
MKKIVASLICILFLGGCSNKTAGMVAIGVIHSPQIVALGALTVVTSPFWILEKIEENSRKAKERIEKDSSLSVPFYKLVDLCNPKFNLEPKITDEFLEEIKHELSYFKEREKYFLQILNKLNDEKSEEYKKFTQEYEKNSQKYILAYKKVFASENDAWLRYSFNEMDKKRLYAFYKSYEYHPFIENAKILNENKVFAVSDREFDDFYFDDEFLVKSENEVLEKLGQEHIKEYKKFKEKIFKDSKKVNQNEIALNDFMIFFQIENEKFKPILGYVSYKLANDPEIHCTFINGKM